MHRTVFFISDGTAITSETVGHSLLTQFPDVRFSQVRIPFVSDPGKAQEAVRRINEAAEKDSAPPIVFNSIVDEEIGSIIMASDAVTIDLFGTFLGTLERALGVKRESKVGRAHGVANPRRYEERIDATNYALNHDDGVSTSYLNADLILVGVSRSGKTPTCLYMALHFGVKAANYPLTQTDLENQALPSFLKPHRAKIAGLTIDADRLSQIRETRRPGSRYASLKQCYWEVESAESLLRMAGVPTFHTTHSSIEEIASRVLLQLGLQREMF
ncbi:posphoenolpyruvate synthetase regulatory kinase/phosphorylase PpsR [Elongatibacter sediminis]|uniref:Putative phosphoenolpyruvate synthase regulatory protein n=1 Tax=Elongatibacter sediminis TaxID=3119006 RepID=A0AAW9RDK6_9GAMM